MQHLNDPIGYLDFTSGIGVTNIGHNHPHVVEAIKQQVDKVILTQTSCYLGSKILELSEEIRQLVAPGVLDCVFFANSGTEVCSRSFHSLHLTLSSCRRPPRTL